MYGILCLRKLFFGLFFLAPRRFLYRRYDVALLEGSENLILQSTYDTESNIQVNKKLTPTLENLILETKVMTNFTPPMSANPADFTTVEAKQLTSLKDLEDDTLDAVLDYFPKAVIRNYLI